MNPEEGSSVPEMASQLELLMDDQGDFLEAVAEEEETEEVETEEESEVETEEESEEDAEEEDEGDEPEEESEEEPQGDLYEIEIDGETYEVNKEELVSGYLRNEQLVNRQSALEQEHQEKLLELEQERAHLLEKLESVSLEANVSVRKFENINWAQLKATDPEGYKDALVQYTEARQEAARQDSQRSQLLSMHQKAQQLRHESYLKEQQRLAQQLIPELGDEGFATSLISYGKSIGFTEDELRSISDAKAIFILNQARLYSESQLKRKEAASKVSKDLPRVIKPGAPKTKTQEAGRKTKALRSKLNQTHDLRDAAALLESYV